MNPMDQIHFSLVTDVILRRITLKLTAGSCPHTDHGPAHRWSVSTKTPLTWIQRQEVFRAIASSVGSRETTWIFTDQQSSNELGRSVALEYRTAAAQRGSPFLSVILTCEIEENRKRLVSGTRGDGSTTKLTDPDILNNIRMGEDIYRCGAETELVLDVTKVLPTDAASNILEHMRSRPL